MSINAEMTGSNLSSNDKAEMSLVEHLQELRQRLIKIIIAIIIPSIVCYFYVDKIVDLLIVPAGKLYYLSPAEAFFTYCKVAVIAGFVISIPIIMYQIWAFLLPAFTVEERYAGLILVPSSIILFYIGLLFSYYLVLPMAINFFIGFSSEYLQPMFSMGQYIGFVLSMLFPFGIVFELPLFILVMARFGIINSSKLSKYRKYSIVFAFIIGGVVSPTPDIFGQTMLALPIIILYEFSYTLVKYVLRK